MIDIWAFITSLSRTRSRTNWECLCDVENGSISEDMPVLTGLDGEDSKSDGKETGDKLPPWRMGYWRIDQVHSKSNDHDVPLLRNLAKDESYGLGWPMG